jgi:hypothetical protein
MKQTSIAAGCLTPAQGPRSAPAHGGSGAGRVASSWSPMRQLVKGGSLRQRTQVQRTPPRHGF